jgi:hypothetical protein
LTIQSCLKLSTIRGKEGLRMALSTSGLKINTLAGQLKGAERCLEKILVQILTEAAVQLAAIIAL